MSDFRYASLLKLRNEFLQRGIPGARNETPQQGRDIEQLNFFECVPFIFHFFFLGDDLKRGIYLTKCVMLYV